jgi:hypothetical protein
MQSGEGPGRGSWKQFVKRHSKFLLVMAGGIAAGATAALSVFLWVRNHNPLESN